MREWHPSQKLREEDDGRLEMRIETSGRKELIRWILSWTPDLSPGEYTVNAKIIYDLNRYNERSFAGDQKEIYNTSLPLKVAVK